MTKNKKNLYRLFKVAAETSISGNQAIKSATESEPIQLAADRKIKVARIKRQVARGKYLVDSEDVACSIIKYFS